MIAWAILSTSLILGCLGGVGEVFASAGDAAGRFRAGGGASDGCASDGCTAGSGGGVDRFDGCPPRAWLWAWGDDKGDAVVPFGRLDGEVGGAPTFGDVGAGDDDLGAGEGDAGLGVGDTLGGAVTDLEAGSG